MAGEDANVEIALARSLVDHLDEGDARRLWSKVASSGECGDVVAIPLDMGPDQQVLTASKQGLLFDDLDWAN